MPKVKFNEPWTIVIDSWGGFCQAWFDNSYPFYGNKNQASAMTNIDMVDPNVLTQGPGAVDLTDGDENGAVTTLISSVLKTATSSNVSFAVGEDQVYKISATAVTDDGTWPLSITGGTYQVADDLIYYKSNIYVFWNDTGTEGEIAKVDISGETIDPDWGSTVPTGAAHLEDAPHYAINGGDDVVYITNGQYVATLEGTTLTVQGIDFWTDAETVSVTWNRNRVLIAVNRPNVTGSNFNESGIYTWNGVSSSWEGDPIEVSGEIGALYTKNGVTFVWWKDGISTGGYQFGYISGTQLVPLRRYYGSLPNQAQVGEYKGFIAWVSSNAVYMWGARDQGLPVKLFQYMSGLHATIGAFASPFGTLLISSHDGSTQYSLAKASGYTTSSTWKTIAFKMNGPGFKAEIDLIQVETETLGTGAKADFTLTYDKAASSKALTQITSGTIHKILNRGPQLEDFRLDLSFANGSTVNPCKIRSIMISGRWIKSN